MGLELCYEYTRRYHKVHKTQARLEWLICNIPTFKGDEEFTAYMATDNIPDQCSPIPLAMPTNYHHSDPILSYRLYYLMEKGHLQDKTVTKDELIEKWNMQDWVKVENK